MPKLIILPDRKTIEIDGETNLLEALRREEIYIRSSCGGHGSCSDCKIKVKSGEDNLTDPTFEEMQMLGNVFHITKERLSCQTKLLGDATIDISAHDQTRDQERILNKSGPQTKKRSASEAQEARDKQAKDFEEMKRPEPEGGMRRPKYPHKK